MRLDHLHLQNFRCYEDAQFDFNPHFNLIVGVNGSGKTSLLMGIAASMSSFIEVTGTGASSLLSTEEHVRFVVDSHENRIRYERRYPLSLHAEGSAFSLAKWGVEKERNGGLPPGDARSYTAATALMKKLDAGESVDLPLLAFYRSHRSWITSNLSLEIAATARVSRLNGYNHWSNAAIDLPGFESWLIGKTLERLENIANSGVNSNSFDDELSWVNSALKHALPKSQGFRYDLKLRSLVVDLSAGHSVPFNDLSDGQRGVVGLIGDIARRICTLNPHMGAQVLSSTPGLVIIDEIDIHLHPAWQRTITHALRSAFPKVQFIAASHSPQVIGSLKPEEVIVLTDGDASHPRVTYGLDSSSVLEEVMGVPERDQAIDDLLNELFSTLADNNIEKARQQLVVLKSKAPNLPEFAGAEALIKRKEILGK